MGSKYWRFCRTSHLPCHFIVPALMFLSTMAIDTGWSGPRAQHWRCFPFRHDSVKLGDDGLISWYKDWKVWIVAYRIPLSLSPSYHRFQYLWEGHGWPFWRQLLLALEFLSPSQQGSMQCWQSYRHSLSLWLRTTNCVTADVSQIKARLSLGVLLPKLTLGQNWQWQY